MKAASPDPHRQTREFPTPAPGGNTFHTNLFHPAAPLSPKHDPTQVPSPNFSTRPLFPRNTTLRLSHPEDSFRTFTARSTYTDHTPFRKLPTHTSLGHHIRPLRTTPHFTTPDPTRLVPEPASPRRRSPSPRPRRSHRPHAPPPHAPRHSPHPCRPAHPRRPLPTRLATRRTRVAHSPHASPPATPTSPTSTPLATRHTHVAHFHTPRHPPHPRRPLPLPLGHPSPRSTTAGSPAPVTPSPALPQAPSRPHPKNPTPSRPENPHRPT